MPGIEISALPASASAELTDVFPVDQLPGPVTRKDSLSQVLSLFQSNGQALTRVDDTNVTITLGGSASTALLNAASLTMGWTGQLAVGRGGTGLASTTINQLLYSSSNNVIAGLAAATGGVLISSNTQVPSWLANPSATGRVLTSVSGAAPAWSTATFPSTAGAAGTILQSDGTNWIASTPTYPTTAGSAGQIFRSNGTNFALTTATYPATTTANQLLYSSAANTVTGLATANNCVVATNGSGVPSLTTTIGADLQINTIAVGLGGSSLGSNCRVGGNTLGAVTTGDFNAAFGTSALAAVTTGTANSASGIGALNAVTTSSDNVGHGRSAGALITTGTRNTMLGRSAGSALTTNDDITAIGYFALLSATGGTNTGVGSSVGRDLASGSAILTTGTGNTLIGYLAGVSAATASGCLALGNRAVANAATGSTSADDGPGIAIGSAALPVGFRGNATIYPTAGASAGYWLVKINGTEYKIQLYAKT